MNIQLCDIKLIPRSMLEFLKNYTNINDCGGIVCENCLLYKEIELTDGIGTIRKPLCWVLEEVQTKIELP